MRFSLTKAQEMLHKSFAEFLSAKCKSEDRHEWLAGEDGFSRKIWREIAELGWPGLIIDDAGCGPTLFILDREREGLASVPLRTIDDEKVFALRLTQAPASPTEIIGSVGNGAACMMQLWPGMILLKCAEMIGGMQKVLEMTVSYAKARQQFGRPLGSFQAIQHHCADMAGDLEMGRLLACHAASLIDGGSPCDKAVAMAKAWCSDAYPRCCEMAHQIHGAYGVTEECDLHLFTKHAKTAELMFGHAWFHRSRVASAMGL